MGEGGKSGCAGGRIKRGEKVVGADAMRVTAADTGAV